MNERSCGRAATAPSICRKGTLYPALHRLERASLLASRWSEVNGRRRRVYQLTTKGHKALASRHGE